MLIFSRFLLLKKATAVSVLFLLFVTSLFTQRAPIEIGRVSSEDLKMTTYEADTSAAAIVLCDFGRIAVEEISNEYKCRFYRHRRIKILKESGFSHGDVFLPYYSYNKNEQLGRLKANIFAPDGTMTSLGKKDFYKEKLSDKYTAIKFAFPNVQVGSVIEYEYAVVHDNVTVLPEWYFQESIPVRWNELHFTFPEKFAYTYLFEGNRGMTKRVEDKTTYLDGESGQMIIKNRHFVMKNSVAMKREPHITTMDDYKARVRFQLDAYVDGYGVKKQILSSWSEVVKDLEYAPRFGLQYTRKRLVKKANEALQPKLIGLSTQREKAKAIYQFIAENMAWDGKYRDFSSRDLNETWEQKKGSSADLNFMLLSLLRQNGFEAYPLMTSTRSHGKMYEKYPMLHQFNHTMVLVNIDGKDQIMDVPTKTRRMDMPTKNALNKRGVVIKSPEAVWVDIDAPIGSDAFMYELTLDENGSLNGNLKTKYKGYNARPERSHYKDDEEGQHWKERFEDFSETTITIEKFENLDNIYEPFKENLQLTIPEAATVAGDFIYLSPILYSGFKENIFKLEKRYFPVDMTYPIQEQIVIKLKIPAGYVIEELPQPANLALANNAGKFRFAVEKKDEQNLQIISSFKLNQLRFEPSEYPNLRELFDLIAEKYGEQIVLKKG